MGTVVQLNTIRDPLTPGFLVREKCGRRLVDWLVDTGASTTLLSVTEWKHMPELQELHPAGIWVMCAERRPIDVRGAVYATIDWGQCVTAAWRNH